ncbi:hypothetical protein EX30DRAFT_318527 [Ascodesmis nigricans]|uniref:Glycosyltransferase family 69 protein n=1 Tax=Ascodesmis nigricans TaxID=341454 RepID=A0A4V3SIY0_9PEZI|nr:hypothetical protein EX30DRAFT_318527 [Ascodesmis nigricans]
MRLPRRLQRFLIVFFISILLYRLYRRTFSSLHPSPPLPTTTFEPSFRAPAPAPTVPENLERIFIAANLHDVAASFPAWSKSVLELVNLLGQKNVFLSIHEAGSRDGTKELLQRFEGELDRKGINNRVVMDDEILEELKKEPKKYREGWTFTARKKWELRQVPWQAKMRNKALEPLEDDTVVNLEKYGMGVGWILFLGGGIYFNPVDILHLISTNSGSFAAACGLDFMNPPELYDTFSLRDFYGRTPISPQFPYFSEGDTRIALLRGDPAVLVKSCWNGLALFRAAPFLPPTNLRFRSIDDSLAWYHVDASERCLIHYDNPDTPYKGVWLNPRVRVAYSETMWARVKEMPLEGWRRPKWIVKGEDNKAKLPRSNEAVESRVREWGQKENAVECLVEGVQVAVWDGNGMKVNDAEEEEGR